MYRKLATVGMTVLLVGALSACSLMMIRIHHQIIAAMKLLVAKAVIMKVHQIACKTKASI